MQRRLQVKWEDIQIWSVVNVEKKVNEEEVEHFIRFTYTYRDFAPRTLEIPARMFTREGILRAVEKDLEGLFKPLRLPPY